MIKKKDLNQKDKKTWENFIKDPSGIYDKEQDISNNNQKSERYKFDLHGFSLDDANSKVKEIIEYCVKKKFRELLLITGKGIHSTTNENIYVSKDLGKLRYSVPEFIKTNLELNKLIISINDAEKKDGGDGAILIKLKNL